MGFAAAIVAADAVVLGHLGSVSVEYQPTSGDPVTVQGIFDENYVLLEAGHGGVQQVGPAVSLRVSELPVAPENDDPVLTIGGRLYRVREHQPDSLRGMSLFLLRRADL
jgi:hypothetical protein